MIVAVVVVNAKMANGINSNSNITISADVRVINIDDIVYKIPAETREYSIVSEAREHTIVKETREHIVT